MATLRKQIDKVQSKSKKYPPSKFQQFVSYHHDIRIIKKKLREACRRNSQLVQDSFYVGYLENKAKIKEYFELQGFNCRFHETMRHMIIISWE